MGQVGVWAGCGEIHWHRTEALARRFQMLQAAVGRWDPCVGSRHLEGGRRQRGCSTGLRRRRERRASTQADPRWLSVGCLREGVGWEPHGCPPAAPAAAPPGGSGMLGWKPRGPALSRGRFSKLVAGGRALGVCDTQRGSGCPQGAIEHFSALWRGGLPGRRGPAPSPGRKARRLAWSQLGRELAAL